jgi:hypothetical protein
MKAWDDIINSDKTLVETKVSFFYIDMGVKIEKYKDSDLIRIKNTMTYGEFFEEVTPSQRYEFSNRGWIKGCCVVNMDVISDKIEKLNKSDENIELIKKYELKYKHYDDKYKNEM